MTLRKRVWGGPMSLRKISQASFAGGPVMLRKGGPMTLRKTAFAGPLSLRTGTREPETEPRSLNARPARRDCGTFGEHHRKFGDRRVRHLAHQLHEHVRDRTVNRRRVSSTTRSGLERVRLASAGGSGSRSRSQGRAAPRSPRTCILLRELEARRRAPSAEWASSLTKDRADAIGSSGLGVRR